MQIKVLGEKELWVEFPADFHTNTMLYLYGRWDLLYQRHRRCLSLFIRIQAPIDIASAIYRPYPLEATCLVFRYLLS